MTKEELKAAYEYGKEAIKDYKATDQEVPVWVYERVIELADMLMAKQEN